LSNKELLLCIHCLPYQQRSILLGLSNQARRRIINPILFCLLYQSCLRLGFQEGHIEILLLDYTEQPSCRNLVFYDIFVVFSYLGCSLKKSITRKCSKLTHDMGRLKVRNVFIIFAMIHDVSTTPFFGEEKLTNRSGYRLTNKTTTKRTTTPKCKKRCHVMYVMYVMTNSFRLQQMIYA
jgi:hypothetical protein